MNISLMTLIESFSPSFSESSMTFLLATSIAFYVKTVFAGNGANTAVFSLQQVHARSVTTMLSRIWWEMALTQQILVLVCKPKTNRLCCGCHLSEVLDINLSDWWDSYQLLFSKHDTTWHLNVVSKHDITKTHLISLSRTSENKKKKIFFQYKSTCWRIYLVFLT